MNKNDQNIFEIFRQGEEEICIASLARWNAQLKGRWSWKEGVEIRGRRCKY